MGTLASPGPTSRGSGVWPSPGWALVRQGGEQGLQFGTATATAAAGPGATAHVLNRGTAIGKRRLHLGPADPRAMALDKTVCR